MNARILRYQNSSSKSLLFEFQVVLLILCHKGKGFQHCTKLLSA